MAKTVRETIKEITHKHLKQKKSLILGQCLSAIGWVGGTVPQLKEKDGITELSMADVANGGIVVGAGLSNRRPIYVIRYQGFNWFNAPIILNYACKSKEIWKVPCPIFIRGIAMEGSIGPVAGSSHHSIYYRMPGIKIMSPMTPKEYFLSYKNFMKDNDVYYISEPEGDVKHQKDVCRNGYPYCYGWENFGFYIINNLNGTEIYMDCNGKLVGLSTIDSCGICGGLGPQYPCEINNNSYCTEYEFQQKCAEPDTETK